MYLPFDVNGKMPLHGSIWLRLVIFQPLFGLIHALPRPGPDLVARDDAFSRGWALASWNADCPDGTFRCGRGSCCPNDAWCYTTSDTESNICCPDERDCAYHIALDSRCANTSWVLWTTNLDPICCLPGQEGVQPADGNTYGDCVAQNSSIPTASVATKVRNYVRKTRDADI